MYGPQPPRTFVPPTIPGTPPNLNAFRVGQPNRYQAQPFLGRVGQMQPLPMRQQIAQQMTQPAMQPPLAGGFQGSTGLNVPRGTRRTIQPVMPGTGMY